MKTVQDMEAEIDFLKKTQNETKLEMKHLGTQTKIQR